MKTIAMDVDDVCALLSETWVAKYNKDWKDNLKVNEITEWAIEKFVKPECGMRIFSYLDNPKLYDSVQPMEGARKGVKALRTMGYRVVFTTSCPIVTSGRKYYWLKDNMFAPTEKDYIEARDKTLLKFDYMLDDRYDNVLNFEGKGILFTRPWNKKYAWDKRANSWDDVLKYFSKEISLWS